MGISIRSTQLPRCTGITQICTAKCDSRSSYTNGAKDAASPAHIPSSGSLGKAPDVPDRGLDIVLEEQAMAGMGSAQTRLSADTGLTV